jgi:hypothetical protein
MGIGIGDDAPPAISNGESHGLQTGAAIAVANLPMDPARQNGLAWIFSFVAGGSLGLGLGGRPPQWQYQLAEAMLTALGMIAWVWNHS